MLWHWPGGETFAFSPLSSQQTLHAISGNRVVYTDSRNGNADIFAFDFTFTPPLASLSTGAVSFGNQQVGVPRGLQTFRIMNGGNGHLDVTGLSFSTPDFYTTTPLPFSVLSGGSASVDVWFSPTTTGSRTGTITIVDNSPSSPESVSLSGYGINPIATLSPTSINFGNQQVSTISVPAGVTVTNTGVGC